MRMKSLATAAIILITSGINSCSLPAPAALAAVLFMSGCATPPAEVVTVPVVVALESPPRPILPPVPADDLKCLSVETYETLVTRQRLLRQYAEELEGIIQSTHTEGIE